jgi:hypothetical protein
VGAFHLPEHCWKPDLTLSLQPTSRMEKMRPERPWAGLEALGARAVCDTPPFGGILGQAPQDGPPFHVPDGKLLGALLSTIVRHLITAGDDLPELCCV